MRVSVTTLDTFKKYLTTDYVSFDDLIASILGTLQENRAMQIGSAFHSALEHARYMESYCLINKGITFLCGDVDEYVIQSTAREIKTTCDIEGVTVVGKADTIHGTTVIDHKTTSRLDIERYFDSVQWRLYLQLFNCNKFIYQVFEIETSDDAEKYDVIRIKDIHHFSFFRYPGMEEENRKLIQDFKAFHAEHVEGKYAISQ